MQNIILRSLFITKEAILMEKLNLNLFIVVYQENLLLHRLRKKNSHILYIFIIIITTDITFPAINMPQNH